MKYVTTLALIVASSLILSGCTSKTSTTTPSNTEGNSQSQEEKSTGVKSLRDLLSLGLAQKCSWSSNDDEGSVTGEILVSGKKFKQENNVNLDGKSVKSIVISDGEWIYSWNADIPQTGFKMKLDDSQAAADNNSGNQTDGSPSKVDFDQQVDYKCSPATVTDADFAVPSTVKFTDFSDFQKDFNNLNLDELKKFSPGSPEDY